MPEVVVIELVVVQPAIQELQLEGQAALSVQGQLGRRSQLSRVSPNSKRLVYNASNTCSDFICCALKGFFCEPLTCFRWEIPLSYVLLSFEVNRKFVDLIHIMAYILRFSDYEIFHVYFVGLHGSKCGKNSLLLCVLCPSISFGFNVCSCILQCKWCSFGIYIGAIYFKHVLWIVIWTVMCGNTWTWSLGLHLGLTHAWNSLICAITCEMLLLVCFLYAVMM